MTSPMPNFDCPIPTGKEFKKWRLDNGLSISEATELFGFKNISSIYQIENGRRGVPKHIAMMISMTDFGDLK